MAVDWGAIQALVDQGFKANPNGTITAPTGQTLAGSTNPAAPMSPAAPTAAGGASTTSDKPTILTNPDGQRNVIVVDPQGRTLLTTPEAAQQYIDAGWKYASSGTSAEAGDRMNAHQQAAGQVGGWSGGGLAKPKSKEEDFDGQSAASVKNMLRQYGLEELIPDVDGWIREGLSWPEIEAMLRDPTSKPGKIFDTKFPEIRLRTEQKLAPMSVAQIQQYRTVAKQYMRSAGLPQGFYDEVSDFTNFIVGDVSLDELQTRVRDGFTAVASAPKEVREAFGEFFGTHGDAALASYFLDKDKALPALQKAVEASKVGGAARQFGFGIDKDRATSISETGADFGAARSGFSNIRNMDSLFTETASETVDFTAEGEGVDAAFGLNGGGASKLLTRRLGERVAAGEGSGGAAAGERGVYGLGSARQ